MQHQPLLTLHRILFNRSLSRPCSPQVDVRNGGRVRVTDSEGKRANLGNDLQIGSSGEAKFCVLQVHFSAGLPEPYSSRRELPCCVALRACSTSLSMCRRTQVPATQPCVGRAHRHMCGSLAQGVLRGAPTACEPAMHPCLTRLALHLQFWSVQPSTSSIVCCRPPSC